MHLKKNFPVWILALLIFLGIACSRSTSVANTPFPEEASTAQPAVVIQIHTITPQVPTPAPILDQQPQPSPSEAPAIPVPVIEIPVAPAPTTWAPAWADPSLVAAIDAMTLEQKVRYLLWCTFSGKNPEGAYQVCRVAFYLKPNITKNDGTLLSDEQIRANNLSLETRGIMPVIDDEGGQVCRWDPAECGASATEIFQTTLNGDWNPFNQWAENRFQKFQRTGFRLLLITLDSGPGIGNQRNFANNPADTAEAGKRYVAAGQGKGITFGSKHVPGLGKGPSDSHEGPVIIPCNNWSEIQSQDLVPFNAVIPLGVNIVMVNHAQYHCAFENMETEIPGMQLPLWSEGVDTPASLSYVINARLRVDLVNGDKLAFVTDALGMGAVGRDPIVATIMAIASGEDAVILTPVLKKDKDGNQYVEGDPNVAFQTLGRVFTSGIRLSELGLRSADPANPDPLLLLDQGLLNLKVLRLMSAGL
jgi:beta-N-acetylhexosaminidase